MIEVTIHAKRKKTLGQNVNYLDKCFVLVNYFDFIKRHSMAVRIMLLISVYDKHVVCLFIFALGSNSIGQHS